jgi:hypothetical protein
LPVRGPIDQARIEELLADFQRQLLCYLRLLPLGRSVWQHIVAMGRWQPYAGYLPRRTGFPGELGERGERPKWAYFRVWMDDLQHFAHGIANH